MLGAQGGKVDEATKPASWSSSPTGVACRDTETEEGKTIKITPASHTVRPLDAPPIVTPACTSGALASSNVLAAAAVPSPTHHESISAQIRTMGLEQSDTTMHRVARSVQQYVDDNALLHTALPQPPEALSSSSFPADNADERGDSPPPPPPPTRWSMNGSDSKGVTRCSSACRVTPR